MRPPVPAEVVEVETRSREEFVDITKQVQQAVFRSGVGSGIAVVMSLHTTAAVTINEKADPDVRTDMTSWLSSRVPQDPAFRHAEGNSDAHVKVALVGPSQALVVEEGRIQLGTWQAIFLAEFDGPRRRRVLVKVVGL